MNARFLIHSLQLLPIIFVGFLLPCMDQPRRGLFFGVTVPLDFAKSAVAKGAVRRYRIGAMAVATMAIVACLAVARLQSDAFLAAAILFLELIAVMVLWQRERRVILPHGVVVPIERTASLGPRHDLGALLTTASSALPVIVTALWLHFHRALLAERWPRQWNAAGVADDLGVRSVGAAYAPCLVGLMLVLLFTGMNVFLSRAAGPGASHRINILAPMAGAAWAAVGVACWTALLPLRPHVTAKFVAISAVVYTLSLLVVAAWLLARMKVDDTINISEAYDGTPDSHWYGGIFYYNPADAAVLVPKRYGWGWTFNFARPAAWVFTATVVGFAVCCALLQRLR